MRSWCRELQRWQVALLLARLAAPPLASGKLSGSVAAWFCLLTQVNGFGSISSCSSLSLRVKGRKFAPKGDEWEKAVEYWKTLPTDQGATFDKTVEINAENLEPFVTWGTSPGMSVKISEAVPELSSAKDESERKAFERALEYMALEPAQKIEEIEINRTFIGSCTNSRIEDLREVAKVAKGYKVNPNVHAMIVPGSMLIKKQAEDEGLAKIFVESGFEWRDAGCSMCLGMNGDILLEGERCASTSNRNFEGRQGKGGRTHLVSPSMAAAAAIAGHFVDVRDWKFND